MPREPASDAAAASRRTGQPRRLAVVGLAGANRGDPRLGHVRRRLEVGLADLEVDDVAARRLERAGAGEDGERALGAEAADGLGDARSSSLRVSHRLDDYIVLDCGE